MGQISSVSIYLAIFFYYHIHLSACLSLSVSSNPSTCALAFLCRLSLSLFSLCPPPSVSYLAGAHRAPITVQHPDLPTVLDLVVVDTVAGAVVPVGAPAVIASLQVEAHCVVGTGVPPRLAFINICGEHKKDDIIHMLSGGNTIYAWLLEMGDFFCVYYTPNTVTR